MLSLAALCSNRLTPSHGLFPSLSWRRRAKTCREKTGCGRNMFKPSDAFNRPIFKRRGKSARSVQPSFSRVHHDLASEEGWACDVSDGKVRYWLPRSTWRMIFPSSGEVPFEEVRRMARSVWSARDLSPLSLGHYCWFRSQQFLFYRVRGVWCPPFRVSAVAKHAKAWTPNAGGVPK